MLIGERRRGKGVITRIPTSVLGEQAIGAFTLAKIASQFGSQPLIGKRAAMATETRSSGPHTNIQSALATILPIVGTAIGREEVEGGDDAVEWA